VGLSRSEIYKRARLGEFPTSRKYPGSDMAFWLSSDVRRWQLALISVAPARTS
jgi:predicted DNA-binding transcriptional regulator AlpA